MTFRTILLGLLVLLLSVATAPAQVMQIHTNDGVESFNLADIDSITFTEEEEGPQAGEEREFQLTDDVAITMVWIPARGHFIMGSPDEEEGRDNDESPTHPVAFEYGFWMGKYEVTQAQWEAVMGENPAHDYGVGDDYPVYYVSWNDIQGFEEELDDAFRLPSEAEWEYVCRAGSNTRFHYGEDIDVEELGRYAWYEDNSSSRAHIVGGRQPNAWGLYDMHGNVWEMCEDWYHNNYSDAPRDGSAWLEPAGDFRIMRGGSWQDNPNNCRSADRSRTTPRELNRHKGFRLVRDAD